MGSPIDVLSLASFASLAIATNASYLNLPYFRYRLAISDRASQTFKQYKNINDNNLINLKEFKLLQELSRIEGGKYSEDKGVEWDCEEGRVYLKTFHEHQDKRISTAALWMSGSYLALSTFSDVSADLVVSAAVSLYLFLIALIIFIMTYVCCDYSQQARFISVIRKRNKLMICPALTLFAGFVGILWGEPFVLYLVPSFAMTAGQYQDAYIFVAGKLSLLSAIAAMICGIFYPMNLIRLGNQVVDKAKHTIDECDASLSPFLDIAKEKIEEELGDIPPVKDSGTQPKQGGVSRKSPVSSKQAEAPDKMAAPDKSNLKSRSDNDDFEQKNDDDAQKNEDTGD